MSHTSIRKTQIKPALNPDDLQRYQRLWYQREITNPRRDNRTLDTATTHQHACAPAPVSAPVGFVQAAPARAQNGTPQVARKLVNQRDILRGMERLMRPGNARPPWRYWWPAAFKNTLNNKR